MDPVLCMILGIIPNFFHLFSTPIYTLITASSSITDVKLSFFVGQHNLVHVGREANAMCNLGHPCSIN